MLISRWRPRSHRYFGTVHVPIIDLEIEDAQGRFRPFSLCVDSGAVVSLLPQSAARVLGVDPSAGKALELGGVGRRALKVSLHDLVIRLANLPELCVPFAIAAHNDVPGLLGRLGVFDHVNVDFDSVRRETRIAIP